MIVYILEFSDSHTRVDIEESSAGLIKIVIKVIVSIPGLFANS